MINYVTMGWLTMDDIVLENGTCRKNVAGGGALYSAIGAAIWDNCIGIHAPVGRPYADRSRREIKSWGLDTSGICTAEGNGLELWMLHESDVHKQQVRKLSSSHPDTMDAARGPLPATYKTARAFHIAPQGPESSISAVLSLYGHGRILTLDILADKMIDADLYANLSYLNYLNAFLPSEAEISQIWSPSHIDEWLVDTSRRGNTHVVGKIGSRGSLVAEANTGALTHIPALKVNVADTTGAGDAYCGGFLVGLAMGKTLIECGAMATVSASFVVEKYGALTFKRPTIAERDSRYQLALSGAATV